MTVRGGGVPVSSMAVNQKGSAASELAADAYPCIMVWVFRPAAYKDVARSLRAPTRSSPRTSSSPTRPTVPACSKPSRTSPLWGGRYAPSLMRWTAPHKASRCRRVIVADESPERGWDRDRARPAVGEGFPVLLFRLQAGSQSHHGVRFSTPPYNAGRSDFPSPV